MLLKIWRDNSGNYWLFFGGSVVIYWRFLRGVAPKKYSIKHYRPNKKINNFHYCPNKISMAFLFEFWGIVSLFTQLWGKIAGIILRKGGCIVRIIPKKSNKQLYTIHKTQIPYTPTLKTAQHTNKSAVRCYVRYLKM